MAVQEYTKKDLEKLLENPNLIKNNFIKDVCENIKNLREDSKKARKNSVLNVLKSFKDDQVLFYVCSISNKNLISIDRKFIIRLHKKNSISSSFKEFPSESLEKIISKLIGSKNRIEKYRSELLELMSAESIANKTKLKQDFTCFCCRYFFTATGKDKSSYSFYNKLLKGELKIDKKKLSITSEISDFNVFLYPNTHEHLIDSIATAKTIAFNKNRLKLVGNLEDYLIAEESSVYGNHFKQTPYQIIKNNEKNYYSSADKMTTADIFLYNPSNRNNLQGSKKVPQEYFSLLKKKTLNHNEFIGYMNKAMHNAYIVPISLKKLEMRDMNNVLISSKVSVINISNENSYVDKVTDPFLLKVIELLSITDMSTFQKKMKEVIHIKKDTINLNMYGTRATFDFEAQFKGNKKEIYDVFIQQNQIYIKPPGSSSNSGLGGVTLEYIKDNIIKRFQRGQYFDALLKIREYAFQKAFNYDYDVVNNIINNKIDFDVDEPRKSRLVKIIKKYKILEKKYKNNLQQFRNDCVNRINLKNKTDMEKRKQDLMVELKKKRSLPDILDFMVKNTTKGGYTEKELEDIVNSSRWIQKFKSVPLLKVKRILGPNEYEKVFANLPNSQKDEIAIRYLKMLENGIETKVKRNFFDNQNFYESKFQKQKKGVMTPLTTQEREKLICSKLSTMEFLYYIGCNERILLEWIKNGVIMGIYGVASASGIIIMNGKNINLGKFGEEAIKRRNAMYVKIGK